jgi:truncated hemoglobin YjbI
MHRYWLGHHVHTDSRAHCVASQICEHVVEHWLAAMPTSMQRLLLEQKKQFEDELWQEYCFHWPEKLRQGET